MVLRDRSIGRTYQLEQRIAAGGMGEIYSAVAEDLSRAVAVKRVLDAADADDDDLRLMFLREVAVAATLEHQNVVEVLDAGQAGSDFFLVMEYVAGPSLAEILDVLKRNGRMLPVELAIGIISSVAHGLAHAHERALPDGTPLGIVHRDVAPENILIGLDGVPKILDFGLAKLSGHSLTQPGVVRGRPRCLSPEQARGDKVDARSDIFSLGALFFELVSGLPLYPNESMATLLWKVAAAEYEPIAERLPNADPDLVQIIEKAVAVDPADRFNSARRMERQLSTFSAARGLRVSTESIAKVVAAVLPSVQIIREHALDGTAGDLEGRRLVLVAERRDPALEPQQEQALREDVRVRTAPTPVPPQLIPPPPSASDDLRRVLGASTGPITGDQPRSVAPAAWTTSSLPLPVSPATQDTRLGISETGWLLYLAAVVLLAALAFYQVYNSNPAPANEPPAQTAEMNRLP